ncbi:DNA adenine methyltransferase YhdJ [Anaerolineae bacterium]|nr:DNA adenine methyltransferase YhdJ [Anaerolineae bacterium]
MNSSRTVSVSSSYRSSRPLSVIHGDCRDLLKTLPANSVKLILTSPPYNLGKEYEKRTSLESYLAFITDLVPLFVKVLKDNGSLCWQVGNYVRHGEVLPLDILTFPLLKKAGLTLRNRIIWRFGHGLHASQRFSGRYETLLWFTKGENYTFKLDRVRIPQKYPGKRHSKGPLKGKPSGNQSGKNPTDFWEFAGSEWAAGMWDFPNVKANHPEKTAHPCQFPVELAERCILALTNSNDVVLDPFLGSGTTLIACALHGRRGIGIELRKSYVRLSEGRIKKALTNVLPRRQLGRPIHVPSGKDLVAQIPVEWR